MLKVQLYNPEDQHTRFHCYDNHYHPPISRQDCVRASIIEHTRRRKQSYLIFHRMYACAMVHVPEKNASLSLFSGSPLSAVRHLGPIGTHVHVKTLERSLSLCLLRKKEKKKGERTILVRQSSVNIEIVW